MDDPSAEPIHVAVERLARQQPEHVAVVDEHGAPVPFAFVDLQPQSPGGIGQQERTDADGHWQEYLPTVLPALERIGGAAEVPAKLSEAFRQLHEGRPRPVAVEMAMVAPSLLLIFALIFAYGRAGQVNGTLESGTRDAARSASSASTAPIAVSRWTEAARIRRLMREGPMGRPA